MITVKNTHFEKDGHPFFYLADTSWSAFTNITMADWHHYLKTRKAQGYNTIQINILRQWDASTTPANQKVWEPFKLVSHDKMRTYDYSELNEAYLDHVDEMLAVMQAYDLQPALILLWCNYIPDTWVHGMMGDVTNVMPFEAVDNYVDTVTKRFKKYHPIYYISGDTDFPEVALPYYLKAEEIVRRNDPDALVSAHIAGEKTDIYPELLEKLDFFAFQSGHGKPGQDTSFTIPQTMRQNGYTKPMVNSEVCYEFMPQFSPTMAERFTERDVRRSSWQSVLGGANAGITYGAHGIWSWHNTGETFPPGYPYPADWHKALTLPGAMDVSFIKSVVEAYGLTDLVNISTSTSGVLLAQSKFQAKALAYVASNCDVDLSELSFEIRSVKAIDLNNKNVYYPTLDGKEVKNCDLTGDYLLVVE